MDGAIFLGDLMERPRKLGLVAPAFGSGRKADHRRRERNSRQVNLAKGSAGVQILAFSNRNNFARSGVVDWGRLVGLNRKQVTNLDALSRTCRIEDRVFFQRTRKNPDETEPLDKRVDPCFENLGRQRSRWVGF